MINELLSYGEENARTSTELAKILNMDKRDIMQAVRLERLAGFPICSNYKGYYMPENKTELKNTIIRLYKQAKETKRVADAIRKNSVTEL